MINNRNSNSGLAGVASLIVFIALVLVAAITASVILDVSGALEQQASQTGEDAVAQLSSSLLILDANGDVNNDSDGLRSVRYVVTTAAGSAPLNLDDVTISMSTPDNTAIYISEEVTETEEQFNRTTDRNETNVGEFKVNRVRGTGESDARNVIQKAEDRFEIVVPSSEVNTSAGAEFEGLIPPDDGLFFNEADRVSVTFSAGPGGQSFNRFKVPSTITSSRDVIPL